MSTGEAQIRIEFTGFWLGGTGAGRGRELDAVAHRDRWGCPALPMSQVKGQLRETANRLAAVGAAGWSDEIVKLLFGVESDSESGLAFVGEARLEPQVHAHFRASTSELRAQLFRRIAATKIGPAGAAEDRTLRAIEASVPLTLVGRVIGHDVAQTPQWIDLLDAACAATLAFGKLKADGYGRAVATACAVGG